MMPISAVLELPDHEADNTVSPGSWRRYAACATPNIDPEEFFPYGTAATEKRREVRQFCAACPVAALCLEYGISTRQEFGVWGGVVALSAEWRRAGGSTHRPRLAITDPDDEPRTA